MSTHDLPPSAIEAAAALVDAVAHRDEAAVARVLRPLARGDMHAVLVTLAASVDPDRPFFTAPVATHTVEHAVRLAADACGVTEDAVLSGSRKAEDTRARQLACYLARWAGWSYPAIGRGVGRDHSTVMHAVSAVGENPTLRRIAHGLTPQMERRWTDDETEDGAA